MAQRTTEIVKRCALTQMKQEKSKRIEYFNRYFVEDGRGAEITVYSVLQAMTKMSEHKVNGPEDAVVTEITKKLLLVEICTITKCLRNDSWAWSKHRVRGRLRNLCFF